MLNAFVRVLIVEDHELYREFISSAIRKWPDFRIISQTADGEEAVQLAEELLPDLILLDIGLQGLNGIEAARRILRLHPECRILFVSQESSEDVVTEALSTGALGYLLKADAGCELLAGVNSVLLGKKFLSRTIAMSEWSADVKIRFIS